MFYFYHKHQWLLQKQKQIENITKQINHRPMNTLRLVLYIGILKWYLKLSATNNSQLDRKLCTRHDE